MKKYFKWLQHNDVIKIINALSVQNQPTFKFVGGCIRDSILGKLPHDFDIASELTPEKNIKLLQDNNINVIPLALKYGTIIAKLSTYSFEITTLRIDINNFGRHSEVKFSNNYIADAKRRDFTINALYLNPITAEITDYFNGINDLKNGTVRFIGNINSRIKEDYLRILRFIRFYTYFSKNNVNKEQIKTIKLYANKLLILSKERITAELNKIINHKNSTKGIKILNKTSISLILFKQLSLRYNRLNRLNLLAKTKKCKILNILKWMVLITNPKNIINTLSLSKKDIKSIKLILLINKEFNLKYNFSYFLARYDKFILTNAILFALSKANNNIVQYKYLNNLLLEINLDRTFVFCINGNDLINLNLSPGKKLGDVLLQLKEWGIENNITNKTLYLNKAKKLI